MKISFLISLLFAVLICGCKSSILDDPSTQIMYSVPEKAHVKLTVENAYNTIIKTLVDNEQQAGFYTAHFSSDNLAEGMYFYTLEVNGQNTHTRSTHYFLLVK